MTEASRSYQGTSPHAAPVAASALSSFDIIPPLKLFGEVGYVRLTAHGDTLDGPEFLVGAAFSFTKYIGAFADYRISHLDGNGENQSKDRLYDARVGVRLNLGAF